jgi:hypothetical protein
MAFVTELAPVKELPVPWLAEVRATAAARAAWETAETCMMNPLEGCGTHIRVLPVIELTWKVNHPTQQVNRPQKTIL